MDDHGFVPSGQTWTAERIAQLKQLAESGMTARLIGAGMGVTKNAIIGKLRRLRCVGEVEGTAGAKPTPVTKPPVPLTREPWAPKTVKPPAEPVVRLKRIEPDKISVDEWLGRQRCVVMAFPSTHKNLIDLDPNGCRWPMAGRSLLFCNGPKAVGHSSYCAAHWMDSVAEGARNALFRQITDPVQHKPPLPSIA